MAAHSSSMVAASKPPAHSVYPSAAELSAVYSELGPADQGLTLVHL